MCGTDCQYKSLELKTSHFRIYMACATCSKKIFFLMFMVLNFMPHSLFC
jgi:hypothetical protein